MGRAPWSFVLALRSLRSRCAAGSGWLHTSRLAHEQRQQEEEAVPACAHGEGTTARRTVAHTTAGAVAVHTVPTRRRREPLPCWTTGDRWHYHAIWGRRRPHVQLCPADRLLARLSESTGRFSSSSRPGCTPAVQPALSSHHVTALTSHVCRRHIRSRMRRSSSRSG